MNKTKWVIAYRHITDMFTTGEVDEVDTDNFQDCIALCKQYDKDYPNFIHYPKMIESFKGE